MAWNYQKPKQSTTDNATKSSTQDVALPKDAGDTIQSLRWSPSSDHLAAASWDAKARIYQVADDGSAQGVAILNAEGPLFSCDWSKDGSLITAAGADKKVHVLQASTGENISFAAHDAPIREVRFVDIRNAAAPVIATGSWDKTVRYWDVRNTSQALGQLFCGERVYSMDAGGQALVVATADMMLHVVDLANPVVFAREERSVLKHQIRSISVAPTGKIWATGAIDGRVSVNAVDQSAAKNIDFTFRCHRSPQPDANGMVKVWAVNAVCNHPTIENRVASCGSDGTFSFWDIRNKLRLKASPPSVGGGGSVTAGAFDRTGKWFAYAVGYDWSKGYTGNTVDYPIGISLHRVTEDEMHRRQTARK